MPECPPGWRTGPPDFVGVGAQRCGTSWWYRGPCARTPGWFAWPSRARSSTTSTASGTGPPAEFVERYHAFFPRPEGAITGEWTPRYMVDFWTMRLLHARRPTRSF